MKNVELKIKVTNHLEIVKLLKKNKAKKVGVLNQIDTYFNCPTGRLKLREINDKKFELIYYRRPDTAKSKVSVFQVLPIPKKQKNEIIKVLGEAYGIWVIVKKKRVLWMYRNTRVHLDTVSKLGNFLELETVTTKINLSQAKKEHQYVIKVLGLEKYKKVKKSYSDLLK